LCNEFSRCSAETVANIDERRLGGDAGVAASANRLSVRRRGVGAGAGECSQSAGLECVVGASPRARQREFARRSGAWDAERAEAEKLRVELSSAFETQGAELEAVKAKLAEVEKQAATAAAEAAAEQGALRQQVIVLTDKAHTAMARAEEIEKRAEDLKAALATAQGAVSRLTAELEAERQQHGLSREGLAALSTELVTVKARAEAQAGVQEGQAVRLRNVEAELAQARAAAATAREEAAHLRGQTEALHTQQAELIQALKLRDGAAGKVKKP